ncbi:replication factor C subunit 4 [Schistocerca americana]|uniref:replication factor C subunit 4 n=1 Tax=Schistocerca americana TaxID=7009 RepID=UPI001F4F2AE4|nr:replication factor C subunit 4 [Schistocerca americana]
MQSFLKTGKLGQAGSTSKDAKQSSSHSAKKAEHTPWVEKYRPRTVDDVVEQGEVVAVLRKCISGSDLPHLLFYGPPGTGKTSTILAAAKQLFGDIYRERILELNASDERGIQVIRDKVKTFAQLTASGTRPDGRPCPAFKIIILDEADSMTSAAQAALRRTMEKETRSTRFCLICNYVSRIIEPLTSRCTKFRFKPLDRSMILERLQYICTEEKVTYNNDALECLVDMSGGDMRRAITCLQSCVRLSGKERTVHKSDVLEVTGVVPEKLVNGLIEVCRKNDFKQCKVFVDDYLKDAYSAAQLLEQLNEVVISHMEMTDKQKALTCDKIALCTWRLQDGASEYLQLLDLGCALINTLQM